MARTRGESISVGLRGESHAKDGFRQSLNMAWENCATCSSPNIHDLTWVIESLTNWVSFNGNGEGLSKNLFDRLANIMEVYELLRGFYGG